MNHFIGIEVFNESPTIEVGEKQKIMEEFVSNNFNSDLELYRDETKWLKREFKERGGNNISDYDHELRDS